MWRGLLRLCTGSFQRSLHRMTTMNGRYGSRAFKLALTVAGVFAILPSIALQFVGMATVLAGAQFVTHVGRLALAINVAVAILVNFVLSSHQVLQRGYRTWRLAAQSDTSAAVFLTLAVVTCATRALADDAGGTKPSPPVAV